MMRLSSLYSLIFLLTGTNAAGIGEAWQVMPHAKSVFTDRPFRSRVDSSAFEIRTVSGVGRLAPLDELKNARKRPQFTTPYSVEPNALPDTEETSLPNGNLKHFWKSLDDSSRDDNEVRFVESEIRDDVLPIRELFKTKLMMRILNPNAENDDDDDDNNNDNDDDEQNETTGSLVQRIRRQAENETSMEKISTMKSVREARLPETWSTSVQPVSVEFRQRIPLDQVIQQQQQQEEEEASLSNSYRRYHAPRVDFVTSHYRRNYPEGRESRDMPFTRNYYDDYETSWYRSAMRDRDYDGSPSYRRGHSYQYPNRYRTERDYYVRLPSIDPYYYDRYNRYRENDLDLYKNRQAQPKPRRIIYYATLPEVVRKPVDLRNYPRNSYDSTVRPSVTRDGTYKRVPGNVDPSRYRYRHLYDVYDPHARRSNYYDSAYGYTENDPRRIKISTKENLRNDEFAAANERKVNNLVAIRDEDGKLPWPVKIGTEVSIKEDERIPGRKIFGETVGYERLQSAQLQKAPDATGSSELQSDN